MAVPTVTEAEGWAGIAAALAGAAPGAEVLVGPGRFEGAETLVVPSGVTLRGRADTELRYTGAASAIVIEDAHDVAVVDIGLAGSAGVGAIAGDPEAEAEAHDGIIAIRRSSGITVRGCRLRGEIGRWSCVLAVGSTEVSVLDNVVTGALRGVGFVSSRGRIAGNTCHDLGFFGIFLRRDSASPDAPSIAAIERNHCHDNRVVGISLLSSEGHPIAENECSSNGAVGIFLQRDPKIPEAPSVASIERNRCYDNGGTGIALASSEGRPVADNDCWGNADAGIVLERDTTSPDVASVAAVERNRCHDNHGDGIVLQSSEGHPVADNECWRNGKAGIVLQRGPKSPESASVAAIERNRCHDNETAGIALTSSEGYPVADNECWGNGLSGIILQRDEDSPGVPSIATVERNRCHENTESGIVLFSSEGNPVADNECWNNGHYGIVLRRGSNSPTEPSHGEIVRNVLSKNIAGGILFNASTGIADSNQSFSNGQDHVEVVGREDWVFDPPEITNEIIGIPVDVGRVSDRALTASLERGGIPMADKLSGFLGSGGCRECFGGFWFQKSRRDMAGESEAAPPSSDGVDASISIDLTVSEDDRNQAGGPSSRRLTATPASRTGGPVSARLESVFASAAKNAGQFKSNKEVRLALVSPDHQDLAGLIEQVEALRAFLSGKGQDGDLTDATTKLADDLAQRDVKIGAPLAVDYQDRNDFGLDLPASRLFETELMAGRSKSLDCLVEILRNWLTWVVLGGVAILVIQPPVTDFLVSLFNGIVDTPWILFKESWPLLLFVVPLVIHLMIFLVDLMLPPALSIWSETVQFWQQLISQLSAGASLQILDRLKNLPFALELKQRAWRRWMKRRLFDDVDAAVLCVFNIEDWRDADLAALEDIAALRPDDCTLLIIVHVAGRSLLVSGVLRPWERMVAGVEKVRRPVMQILFDDETARFDLSDISPDRQADQSLAGLLGWHESVGAGSEERRRALTASLIDGQWSPYDLMPAAVLGSAPMRRLRVEKGIQADFNQVRPRLARDLGPYREILGDTELREDVIGEGVINDVFKFAGFAEALSTFDVVVEGAETRRLEGRVGRRKRLAGAVLARWPDPVAARSYMARAIGCGELAIIGDIEELLARKGNSYKICTIVRLRLRSLAFLARDRRGLSEPALDIPLLDAAWERLDALIAAAALSVERRRRSGLYLDYLAARDAVDGGGAGAPGEDVVSAAISRVDQGEAEAGRGSDHTGEAGPRAAFVAETRELIEFLLTVDPDLAAHMLKEVLRNDWRRAPARLRDWLENTIATRNRNHRRLGESILRATTADELAGVINLHGQHGLRAIYLLGVTASRFIEDRFGRGGPESQEILAKVGQTLEAVRAAVPESSWSAAGLDGITKTDIVPALRNPALGGFVTDYLCRPEAATGLVAALDVSRPDDPSPIDGLFDDQISQLLGRAERVLKFRAGLRAYDVTRAA